MSLELDLSLWLTFPFPLQVVLPMKLTFHDGSIFKLPVGCDSDVRPKSMTFRFVLALSFAISVLGAFQSGSTVGCFSQLSANHLNCKLVARRCRLLQLRHRSTVVSNVLQLFCQPLLNNKHVEYRAVQEWLVILLEERKQWSRQGSW